MSDQQKYIFKITDFTPSDMPFGRLVEYYSELKKMLGVSDHLHLMAINKSSHASAFIIDPSEESQLQKRILELRAGEASKLAVRARDTINKMLREDSTSGEFSDNIGANVINFPGKLEYEDAQLRMRDAAAFTGELYHIAGNSDGAKVRINTEAYGVVFCTTTKDIAKSLRDYLFEDVKVSGRGLWSRVQGRWIVDDFNITEFAGIKSEGLRTAVDRIRNANIKWPTDVLKVIEALDEKSGS